MSERRPPGRPIDWDDAARDFADGCVAALADQFPHFARAYRQQRVRDVLVTFAAESLTATTDAERQRLAERAEQDLARLTGRPDEIAQPHTRREPHARD